MIKSDWAECLGVSTDGVKTISGGITGLRANITEVSPSAE